MPPEKRNAQGDSESHTNFRPRQATKAKSVRLSRRDLASIEELLREIEENQLRVEKDPRSRERGLADEKHTVVKDFSARLDRLQTKAARARAANEASVRP